jgi:hypothetical protein
MITREQALPYVSYAVDDAGEERTGEPIPDHARLVGYQCGFEPLFVAVWSYLPNCRLDEDEAEDAARDLLLEKHWFSDPENSDADYIL